MAAQLQIQLTADRPLALGDLLKPVYGVKSKGLSAKKAKSLADLHRRRNETDGQFFTPQWIAAGLWSQLQGVLHAAQAHGTRVSVLDSSIGTGRLLEPAPVDDCSFYGIDPDTRCVDALAAALDGSDALYDFRCGRMEDLQAARFDIAIINPPYGLHLESPHLTPYPGTTYGKFGPNTSALSHDYALRQALDAAQIVAALLPVSMDATCRAEERLAAVYRLPNSAFKSEGANVATALYIFARRPVPAVFEADVTDGAPWPVFPGDLGYKAQHRTARPRFRLGSFDASEPTITTPVTGDHTVRLDHAGRRLVLRFRCGLVEAKVLNALLEGDVCPGDRHRYPDAVRFIGDGRLRLDVLLAQPNPDTAFKEVVNRIAEAGGEPEVSPTLLGYWETLKRRHEVLSVPFRHQVMAAAVTKVQWRAKRSFLLIPGDLTSPAVRKGDVIDAVPLGGEYRITLEGVEAVLRRDQLQRCCELVGDDVERVDTQWTMVHPGVEQAFPEKGRQVRIKLARLGIDRWLWPYQVDSLVEQLIRPAGCVAAWEQGTGKARMSLALAYYSGRGLVVVESGLLPEMLIELGKLPIPSDDWQVISSEAQTRSLKALNIVTYETLKREVGSKMLASRLRRRVRTVVADEGSILRNDRSQRSRALLQISARRLVIADGTPMPNYPRDVLPLVARAAGNGIASQPFALNNGLFIEPRLLRSASYAQRGIDRFREQHVVLEWAVHQFREDLREGAKREIPRINNLPGFRSWISTAVQRRLRDEPGVREYAGCPKPIVADHYVPWDKQHLLHYLDVAVNFANWYQQQRAGDDLKSLNLVQVLARIQAVTSAANNPHVARKNSMAVYARPTSKQAAVIDKVSEHVKAGRKTLVYCYSPECAARLSKLLKERHGLGSIVFTGDQNISQRTKVMDKEFRRGDTMVMFSTWVGQRGLNFGMVSAVVLYQRDFAGDVEPQAIARTQRPDQKNRVLVDRFHLKGSIDEYIAQMVDWKTRAADSGLDWGDGATEEDQFLHLDHILEEFCNAALDMSSRESLDYLLAA